MKTISEFFSEIGTSDIPAATEMYYDINYKVSLYLHDYRSDNKLTQKAMARLLGVKQPMIAKLESGDYNFTLKTICEVFSNLGVNVNFELTERAAIELARQHITIDEDELDAYSKTNEMAVSAA